jgi:PAS domain S-box-containing protein
MAASRPGSDNPDNPAPPRITAFAISYAAITIVFVAFVHVGLSMQAAARAYVGGESVWSKAEKQAAQCLQRYASSGAARDYACYEAHLTQPLAHREARKELLKEDFDPGRVRDLFLEGGIDTADVDEMIQLSRWFGGVSDVQRAMQVWEEGDAQIDQMRAVATQLNALVSQGHRAGERQVDAQLALLRGADTRLTLLAHEFSSTFAEASRRIRVLLTIASIIVGLLLGLVAVWSGSRWVRAWRRVAFERIEERTSAQVSVRESEERYRQLVEMSPDAVLIFTDGKLEFVNDTGTRFFGAETPEQLVGRQGADLVHPLSRPSIRRRIDEMFASNQPAPLSEEMFVRLDGSIVEGEVFARPFFYRNRRAMQIIIRDVTDRRRTQEALRRSEEQLRQAQKMEAVGLLAGGVAHDFNNLLTAVQGHAELLMGEPSLPPPLREHAEEIGAAADRAASLTRQLLAFSRRQVMTPRVVDLNVLVRNVQSLIGRLIGADVQLITSLEPEIGYVRADPHQIEQVLLNLVLNARDAMPEGGTLIIETSNTDVAEPRPDMPSVGAGSYVRLVVSDSGVGMSEESRARIFEPFYTTKEMGKGTGLGLSMVYGIVKQSEGHIYARSSPGEGTTMEIYLPRTYDPLDALEEFVAPATARARTGATILVVEDEASVRSLVEVLLTDMVMPGMSGVELATRATATRPQLNVIFMSGYTEDEVFRRGVERGTETFLQKPFTGQALLHAVSEAVEHVQSR